MVSSFDVYYRAMASRDSRFDGRFFVGVKTTGIYCRPICPARTPKPQNVQIFLCAAAAEAAGFRACRRCRPEASPGTPGWLGTSATVSRALRLIAAGALDRGDVDQLALRLGVGARHLRRLFDEHVGASPVAVAATRRTHFARKLIDETSLPMTAIALDAGFASVRRFNDAIRAAFGRPPRELRRLAKLAPREPESPLVVTLPYRPPFDWDSHVKFLAARAIPSVEDVTPEYYRRTIRLGSTIGGIDVTHDAAHHRLRLGVYCHEPAGLMHVVERVRNLFDLYADPLAIERRLGGDAHLGPMIAARPGLRVPGCWDPFELAVRAILGQQISVRGATGLAGRIAQKYGTPLPECVCTRLTSLFPQPADLADADVASIGVTSARAATIRELARAVVDGRLVLDGWSEPEHVTSELKRIKGIGDWTVQYIAMRALGEPDAFLPGDVGLRRAAGNGKPATSAELEQLSEAWRPWRSYAVMHLWASEVDETLPACARAQPRKRACTLATVS